MRQQPKVPTFDTLLAAIAVAPSPAALAPLLDNARTYFMGNQREILEAAAATRQTQLPDAST